MGEGDCDLCAKMISSHVSKMLHKCVPNSKAHLNRIWLTHNRITRRTRAPLFSTPKAIPRAVCRFDRPKGRPLHIVLAPDTTTLPNQERVRRVRLGHGNAADAARKDTQHDTLLAYLVGTKQA